MSLVWESVSFTKEKTDCHDQFENWSRNDAHFAARSFFLYAVFHAQDELRRLLQAVVV